MELYSHVWFLSGDGQHEVINSYEKWQLLLLCVALYLSTLNFSCQFIHSSLSHLKSHNHCSQSPFIIINLNIFVPSANITWQLTLFFRSFMCMLNIGPSTALVKLLWWHPSVLKMTLCLYLLFPLFQSIIFQDISFLCFGFLVYLAAFVEGLLRAYSIYRAIFTYLLLILSEMIKEASQTGPLFTPVILTLLKYILSLHMAMNSLLTVNDLSRAELPLLHMCTLVSWSSAAHLSRLKK